MRIKLTWDEFVLAAVDKLLERYELSGPPEFFTRGNYEPDSQAYTFPPHYVEIEAKGRE